jgi:hypothetical protein
MKLALNQTANVYSQGTSKLYLSMPCFREPDISHNKIATGKNLVTQENVRDHKKLVDFADFIWVFMERVMGIEPTS